MDMLTNPRANRAFQGGGEDAPSVRRTLGLGANFALRELVRNGILKSPAHFVYEHCYVPTGQVRAVLLGLGCPLNDSSTPDNSQQIYTFLIEHLGKDKATFDLSFDLPFHDWGNETQQLDFEG